MLADSKATVQTVFGATIRVSDYFVNVLGQPALNMGVFVGIISGFVGATAFNKYYNYRKLPDALTFSMENVLFHLLLFIVQSLLH